MSDTSLYERLGGEQAITATVGLFYEKVMADPQLSPFFADLDVPKQVKKQIAFMTMAFGGPHKYDGKDLRTAHARLVEKGLNEQHFGAVAGHLQAALLELDVPRNLVDEVLGIVGTTKADVLSQ